MAGSLRNLADIMYDQNLEVVQKILPHVTEERRKELESELEALRADADAILSLESDDGNSYINVDASYWASLNAAAGEKYLPKISVPMFILQGDADFQVYPDVDFLLWQEALGERENVVLRLYSGLNHLFMPTWGLKDVMEYDAENKVSEAVIADIAEWINKNSPSDTE